MSQTIPWTDMIPTIFGCRKSADIHCLVHRRMLPDDRITNAGMNLNDVTPHWRLSQFKSKQTRATKLAVPSRGLELVGHLFGDAFDFNDSPYLVRTCRLDGPASFQVVNLMDYNNLLRAAIIPSHERSPVRISAMTCTDPSRQAKKIYPGVGWQRTFMKRLNL